MSFLIGRGRTAHETYPTAARSAGAGGGPRLSRVLYVDGGTTVSHGSQTGAISAPFSTISAALAIIPPSGSAEDNQTLYVVLVTPCLGGYTSEPGGTVTIPAYRNVALQGVPFASNQVESEVLGLKVTASVVWTNTALAAAGGVPPTVLSSLLVAGLYFSGGLTVTDDATSLSVVEIVDVGQFLESEAFIFTGNVDTHGATDCVEVILFGSQIEGTIETAATAAVLLQNATCSGVGTVHAPEGVGVIDCLQGLGPITAGTFAAQRSFINTTVSSAGNATFENCEVQGDITVIDNISATRTSFLVGPLTLTVPGGAFFTACDFHGVYSIVSTAQPIVFDGPSYLSLIEQGGSASGGTVGTGVSVIIGGFLAAPVPNENPVTTPGAPVSVSVDGSGGPTQLGSGNMLQINGPLSAPLTVTILASGAELGDTFLVTRTDTNAHAVTVNDGASAAPIWPNPMAGAGTIAAMWNGSNWVPLFAGANA